MLLSGLYGVTDIDQFTQEDQLYFKVTQALKAGMHLLQYRDKTNQAPLKLKIAKNLRNICDKYNAIFIINDDVDLAVKVNAQGVHLGQKDNTIEFAKAKLGRNSLIGVSCSNSISLATEAKLNGASYVSFGRFFASQTKPDAPSANFKVLNKSATNLGLPICAIGGINLTNIHDLLAYDVDMIAISKGIFNTYNVYDTTKKILEAIHKNCSNL